MTRAFFDSIDWELLRKQKDWLIIQARASKEANGLLELIDALQDEAADEMGYPETLIFGNLDDGNLDAPESELDRKTRIAAQKARET